MNADTASPAAAATALAGPCRPADVAAYLDGELSAAAGAVFEQHAQVCAACATSLHEQRRLQCALDAAFGSAGPAAAPALPRDFSRVVTARAQADMRCVRGWGEGRRALFLCLGLAALACALLGRSVVGTVLAPVRAALRATLTTGTLIWHTLAEAGTGGALILRGVGQQLTGGPGAFRFATLAGLTLAVVLLLRLINNYHRADLPD